MRVFTNTNWRAKANSADLHGIAALRSIRKQAQSTKTDHRDANMTHPEMLPLRINNRFTVRDLPTGSD
jgi:hypothetical protein